MDVQSFQKKQLMISLNSSHVNTFIIVNGINLLRTLLMYKYI